MRYLLLGLETIQTLRHMWKKYCYVWGEKIKFSCILSQIHFLRHILQMTKSSNTEHCPNSAEGQIPRGLLSFYPELCAVTGCVQTLSL